MAGVLRRSVLKGAGALGAVAGGAAYLNRLPPSPTEHRSTTTSMYRNCVAPLLVLTDAETAHVATLRLAQLWQSARLLLEPSWTGATPFDGLLRPVKMAATPSGPSLQQDLFGGRLRFESPVGIAAGFDKNAVLVPIYRLGALPGLGFSEVGSVSALPAQGNEKPRCFRLPPDEAVINRMGLNNEGCEEVAARLQKFAVLGRAGDPVPGASARAPVGVNIAKTHSPSIFGNAALEDFSTSFRTLAPYADFVVVNVSCPNTAEGKTFEEPAALGSLLGSISTARSSTAAAPPVLVKFCAPPDTEEGKQLLRSLVDTAKASGIVDGFVVSNTLPERDGLLTTQGMSLAEAAGRGGLSGPPVRQRSQAAIRTIYERTGGRVPIIGVGGIDSAEAAYAAVRSGASLVEVYTAMVYNGPGLLQDIHVGLRMLLERDGFSSITEAIGVDATR